VVSQVVMPQMGLEVTGGTVVTVAVSVGDTVAEGTTLLEVETDKALTDVVAPRDGVVVRIDVAEGDEILVGATLVHLGDEAGEAPQTDAASVPAPAAATDTASVPAPAAATTVLAPDAVSEPVPAPAAATANGAHRLRVAPVARRAAHHHGLPLESLTGSGPRGRITMHDVEQAVAEQAAARAARRAATSAGATAAASGGDASPPPPSSASPGRLEPLGPTRRSIARRMTQSAQIPQFTLHRDVDMAWLATEKRRLTDAGPAKLSVNDLLVQAMADVVARHPALAAAYVPADDDAGVPHLRHPDGIHVGLAVAGERGLLVPVLRRAHERTLAELALERSRLVTAARSGRLDRDDMGGATITLSSLAAFGVDRFNALLNPGETAILAVGRTRDQLVPREGGIAVVPTATLTLTLDHRVADGATGAAALGDLADALEGGMTWRT
jgi:pyruvate dehydrogenase E2 component (dihydrolipoamide acetyltransferase)